MFKISRFQRSYMKPIKEQLKVLCHILVKWVPGVISIQMLS